MMTMRNDAVPAAVEAWAHRDKNGWSQSCDRPPRVSPGPNMGYPAVSVWTAWRRIVNQFSLVCRGTGPGASVPVQRHIASVSLFEEQEVGGRLVEPSLPAWLRVPSVRHEFDLDPASACVPWSSRPQADLPRSSHRRRLPQCVNQQARLGLAASRSALSCRAGPYVPIACALQQVLVQCQHDA